MNQNKAPMFDDLLGHLLEERASVRGFLADELDPRSSSGYWYSRDRHRRGPTCNRGASTWSQASS